MTTYLTERITVDPERCFGKPTVRGTRLQVDTVLGYLAAGDAVADILEAYSRRWSRPTFRPVWNSRSRLFSSNSRSRQRSAWFGFWLISICPTGLPIGGMRNFAPTRPE
ncbi:MAG: DUF433 domain-containing protein [Hymenobacter sp.]